MKEKSIVCLKEADIAAAFAALGFKHDHVNSYAGWICEVREAGKLGLPTPQPGDSPSNRRVLDFVKDGLNKRGIGFDWSKRRRTIGFVAYPVTDAKRQPSLLEIAVLLNTRPEIFQVIDSTVQQIPA